MKFMDILLILSCLLVALLCVGSVAAFDDTNINDNSLTVDSSNIEIDGDTVSDEKLSTYNCESTLSEPKVIYVDEVNETHTEMNDHTIKKAIDEANAGDTIIIKGKIYYHCHLTIDKQLTIKSEVGTILDPCSSIASSGYSGIFYITKGGSGTIIEGFNFIDDDPKLQDNSYGVLVKGASDVIIRNSTFTFQTMGDALRFENSNGISIDNVNVSSCDNGIKIKSSQNINIEDVNVNKSNIGINVIDSTNTRISNSTISDNKLAGIAFSGSSSNLTVICNNISNNFNGINITAPKYVHVLSNYISFNKRNGIYIDNPITLIEIKGNFFNQNAYWEIFNDFHIRNSEFDKKGQKLEVINNNYMINAGSGSEDIDRPVWTQMYEYKPGLGTYNYDSENDVYVYVGSGGDYDGHQDKMFIAYVFEINEYMHCPNTYYIPSNPISGVNGVWSQHGNYELQISEITQVKKGIYQVSIVDEDGNIATDLSSVPVTFYLNKAGKSSTPQEGDVYKTVMMKNGTATVRFYSDEFNETKNIITAVFPTPGTNIDSKVSKTLAIDDEDIPGEVLNTTISVSDLNTYPNSNAKLMATLTDINGRAVAGETLTVTINSNTYNVTTDDEGKANITISEPKEGTYTLDVNFAGDDIDYYGSSAKASVVVKKQVSKIISSNVYMIPKMSEYYSITLKDSSGKVITNAKVTFKVNGKTYTKYTNSKGVAKVSLKFTTQKTYKITTKFAGNDRYKSISKTNNIVVKYSSKTAKLSTPTVTIPPKTSKYYTVTLKDGNGKGIAKQKVTVKINGKTYTKTTNSKGQVKISVKFTSLKSYKVSASYKGSKIYKKASSSGKINVAKTVTKITAPSVSTLPKVSKTYTVTLKTSAGKALSKQKIDIKINGKTYTKTTSANGKAGVSVKLSTEKVYPVTVTYKGTDIYKASKTTGKITVSRIVTKLECYNRTFSTNASDNYQIALKDKSGNALSGQKINYSINGESHTGTTDSNGKIKVDIANRSVGSYDVVAKFAGDSKYKAASKTTIITIVNKTGIVFVDGDLPNSEIQNILDDSTNGSNVEFLGDYYFGIALTVNNGLNIYSKDRTILNAKEDNPVLNVKADNVNISGFSLQGNSGDAVVINNAQNLVIFNNYISNNLDESKIDSYINGTVNLPGYGVSISNSSNVKVYQNDIDLFESGIFAQQSSDIAIDNNTIRENNYGVKYGFGVENTQITNNEISENIGLYIMTVPEGPSGYGIYLNNSAVNLTVNHNHIAYNHMGISVDANNSTGIVITQNTITDNVLEGIRFNAGYDLAENAVKPLVSDNAIYRNARGPSMMILGELSANPEGIYGGGLYNDSQKLQLDANWYGTNSIVTWDYNTGVVGYGTMCPRINTTEIKFYNVTSDDNGNYSIVFYKNGEVASNLPEFDLYATLNRGTDKAVEVNFISENGAATFGFDAQDYDDGKNTIELSIGSLLNSTSRVFKAIYSFEVSK